MTPKKAPAKSAPAQAVQPPPPAEAHDDEHDKKTRTQLSAVLDINISQARCATHLKQNLGDDEIEGDIKELRKQLKELKEGGAAEGALNEVKEKIAKRSKDLVRISSATPIAVALVADHVAKNLLRYGMDRAIEANRKIVDTNHLHEGDSKNLVYYPLYSKCDAWANYDQGVEDERKRQRAAVNKAAKDARDAKKEAETPAAPAKAAKGGDTKAAKAAKAVPAPAPEDDEDHSKTTFYTYVENALKTVKKDDEKYVNMRVSNRVREYVSDLITQMIARLSTHMRIIVQRVMGVRTVNADHVKAVVNILMADEGRSTEQIESVTTQIDEKLKLYQEHILAEKEKKQAALSEEEKLEQEKKQKELDDQRKVKQIESATRQAIKAAAKAKELKGSK